MNNQSKTQLALTLGIVGIAAGILLPILFGMAGAGITLAMGIVGGLLSIDAKKADPEDKNARTAFTCCIIAIVLGAVFMVGCTSCGICSGCFDCGDLNYNPGFAGCVGGACVYNNCY